MRTARRAGRPRGGREPARRRTEERLLDGALAAVARHGLGKLAMSDVSQYAGLSRGTAYRYFPDTGTLLRELGRREAARFERRVWEALESTPPGEARLHVALDYMARLARDHPLLQRLPETDPGFVLTSLRERFPDIRQTFERLLAPLLEQTDLVRRGVVRADQLVSWMTRVLISAFLIPDPDPEEMAESMKTVYRIMSSRSNQHEAER
jgi:TetR/AcrR family transcriptional regulator, repressor for uid operon